MEKWFALQLFSKQTKTPGDQTEYVKAVQSWLSKNQQDEWQKRIENRRTAFIGVKVFSALAAVFMGLGSTYLIVEAFAVIPFLAASPFAFWPLMILPMAIIAGAAYGLLTYNTITDLINNNTVVKWYNKLRQDLSQGLTPRNLFLATTAVLLVGLAVALTVCTAGTWWTIATNSRPLFEWMTKMPSFIMGIINPIITGASAIFFNVQNSAESLDMVDEATRSTKNIFQRMYQYTANGIKHLRETENWLQMLNPFRILLKLTIAPLRLLFFMGHLISISLTADRMPGVPQILSALVGIISEGFEDAHYFIGHSAQDESTDNDGQEPKHDTKTLLKNRLDGDSEHNQSTDIPTWLLRTVAAPIYALAALWDSSTSQLNTKKIPQGGLQHQVPTPKTLSFSEAWDKQRGVTKEAVVSTCPETQRPSTAWQVEHATALIDRKAKKLEASTFNGALASDKVAHLQALKIKIRAATSSDSIEAALIEDQAKPVYNKHRMFALQNEKTDTQEFIEGLPDRIRLA